MATELKNKGIAKANPDVKANEGYINALYQEAQGRDATKAELSKFANSYTVKDAANTILGANRSPFYSTTTPAPAAGGPQPQQKAVIPVTQQVPAPTKTTTSTVKPKEPAKAPATKSSIDTQKAAKLKNQEIGKANPDVGANDNYINALYRESQGRDATKAELEQFRGMKVKDAANTILGADKSPFFTDKRVTMVNPKTGERKATTSGSEEEKQLVRQGFALEGKTKGQTAVTVVPNIQGATTRKGIEALGYTYLGTGDAKDKAISEGKEVVKVGADYYMKPKPSIQTTDEARRQLESGTNGTTGTTTPAEQIAGQQAPETPNYTQTYADLQKEHGITELEDKLNGLDDELTKLDDAYQAGLNQEEGALRPMELIQGRQREIQKQYLEQRASVQRERDSIARRLESKYNTINTIMSLTQMDYEAARNSYNDAFTQNLQAQQYFSSERRADRQEAQANLNTVMGFITEAGMSWDQMTSQQRTQITRLETESGLPTGIIQGFMSNFPQAKILSTIQGVDESGNDIVSFIYADKNGNPSIVKTMKTGGFTKPSGSGDSTYSERSGATYMSSRIAEEVANVYSGKYGTTGARERALNILKAEFPGQDVSTQIYNNIPDGYENAISEDTYY